jgi:hypothetical protein
MDCPDDVLQSAYIHSESDHLYGGLHTPVSCLCTPKGIISIEPGLSPFLLVESSSDGPGSPSDGKNTLIQHQVTLNNNRSPCANIR